MITPKRKAEIKEAFMDFFSDLQDNITVNKMPDNSYYPSFNMDMEFVLLVSLLKDKNISVEELIHATKDYEAAEIYDIVKKSPDYVSLDSFEELEEVDSFIEDRGERKYQYIVRIFKHKNGNFYKFVQQESDDVILNIEYYGEVEKKEKIVFSWE